FVADGRSPITLSWLRHWIERGDEIHLISTFPCDPPPGLTSFHVLAVAFGALGGGQAANSSQTSKRGLVGRFRGLLRPLRYSLGPLSLLAYIKRFRALVAALNPDLIHALRIPFEGMLASCAPREAPLVVSIWGNDLTLHAHGSFLMKWFTRQALRRAQGLMADARRDIRLGREWGFLPVGLWQEKPTLVVPGAGGIRLDEIQRAAAEAGSLPDLPADAPLIVNPRGARPGSLRNDTFFRAIPLVVQKIPQACFVCPPLAGDPEAERWVASLGIQANVRLWPRLSQPQLWALFQRAQVFVSPSAHDGTPNSLLEAMACGCFPITGDIESLREWINTGVNGFLVNPADPQALAEAILAALEDPVLRARAAKQNARILAERADYPRCMQQVEEFYENVRRGT
ncbi:MAG: glycosyltransferase, partial [Chloroflexi bacterium]|nr:glycosyltransferase [Chloroflexota bacterium]